MGDTFVVIIIIVIFAILSEKDLYLDENYQHLPSFKNVFIVEKTQHGNYSLNSL